jgi:hypothetical protein
VTDASLDRPLAARPLPPAEYRVAWRRDDSQLERDAIAFWRRLGLLPPWIAPEERAKQLCCVAYIAGEVAAVATATIETLPFLRTRAAIYRCATAPEHRDRWLLAQMSMQAFDALHQWAQARPEAGVKGVATILDTPFYAQMKRRPVWRYRREGVELVFVGYTEEGLQLRMAWFPDARLDLDAQ